PARPPVRLQRGQPRPSLRLLGPDDVGMGASRCIDGALHGQPVERLPQGVAPSAAAGRSDPLVPPRSRWSLHRQRDDGGGAPDRAAGRARPRLGDPPARGGGGAGLAPGARGNRVRAPPKTVGWWYTGGREPLTQSRTSYTSPTTMQWVACSWIVPTSHSKA